MANKQILSIVAASVIAASFTFTGCGSSSSTSSSSSSSSTSSSSSSVAPGATIVRVSDAYVLEALVQAGDKTFTTYIDKGQYEIAEANVTGALVASGGVNDANGNEIAETGESNAPTLKAPSGYANMNPYTTMMVDQNKTADELAMMYPATALVSPTFDLDVVAAGEADLAVAKEAATAAVTISGEENGTPPTSSSSSECAFTPGILPEDDPCYVSASSSSVESSSSSTISILPGASTLRGVLPDAGETDDTGTPSSSSSSEASSEGILPGEGEETSSSSSESNVVDEAIAAINACEDLDCVNAATEAALVSINGSYTAPASSSEASSESSSEEATVSAEEQACTDIGGTWSAEVNACMNVPTGSSSSTADAGENVLPGT